MKGRIYDPQIGKFLTPDPLIQDPLRGESLNRYSYAWNNPLKWVDTTGFQDEEANPSESDIKTCVSSCSNTWNFEPQTIVGEVQATLTQPVPSPTADDDGPLSPPPLVNAPDTGPIPYSCCAAASNPSDWAPFPSSNPSYGIKFPPPGFERIRANYGFVDAVSISADTPNLDPNQGTGLEKTYVPVQLGLAATAAIAGGSAVGGAVLRGSISAYSKAPWLWNGLLVAGNAATGVSPRTETAAEAQHIVLGLRNFGLEETAARVGGQTLLNNPNWKEAFGEAVLDPTTRFTVSVEGLSGSSTYSQVMSAVQQGLGPNASPTNWELAQLYAAGRLGVVTFVNGLGKVLDNPFK